jgi:hypothetical protein
MAWPDTGPLVADVHLHCEACAADITIVVELLGPDLAVQIAHASANHDEDRHELSPLQAAMDWPDTLAACERVGARLRLQYTEHARRYHDRQN